MILEIVVGTIPWTAFVWVLLWNLRIRHKLERCRVAYEYISSPRATPSDVVLGKAMLEEVFGG